MAAMVALAAELLASSVSSPADPLMTEIGALDAEVFDAYTRLLERAFASFLDGWQVLQPAVVEEFRIHGPVGRLPVAAV